LEFNVPFQHKYGYIRDKISVQYQTGIGLQHCDITFSLPRLCTTWFLTSSFMGHTAV